MIATNVLANDESAKLTRDKFTVDDARRRIETIFDEYSIKVTPVDISRQAKSISHLVESTIRKSHFGFEIQELREDGQKILLYFRTKTARGYGSEESTVTPSQIEAYERALEKELKNFQERKRIAQEDYELGVEKTNNLRKEELEKRDQLSKTIEQIYGTTNPEKTNIIQVPVITLFPYPNYKTPEMREIPCHEGQLVDDNGDLSTATIESSLIINLTHDLTLPRYRHIDYLNGRASGDVGESNKALRVDKQSSSLKEKIGYIAKSRGVKTSADFKGDGYVHIHNSRSFISPEPSYFYGVTENIAEFGSMLKRVFESGKDVSRLINDT